LDGLDLIGDIHGHAEPLIRLLEQLGYRERFGSYRHANRKAVFLGDFIDRGPGQRRVLNIVRGMVEEGTALAVMGNHELNALAFHTRHPRQPGEYLRRRSTKNTVQHQAFLDEHQEPGELAQSLEWFWQLPLWLDLDELRVVHAAWDPASIAYLSRRMGPEHYLTQELLVESADPGSPVFTAVETLLKGIEANLPPGVSFTDHSGHHRTRARLRWWLDARETPWRELAFLPQETRAQLPAVAPQQLEHAGYPAAAPPVFIGHYWLSGPPAPLAPNVACVDYSVARRGGKLAAYRWDGEPVLSAEKFAWVER
jgi:hypothetical protein